MTGYKGYYKEMALDSSYEYIYCKILEFQNIEYKVHEINYQLSDRQYKPDFFIYNKDNILIEIVEIRGKRLNIEERIVDTIELREMVNIPVKLITEEDLKILCRQNNLSYHKLKTEWRTSPHTHKNYNKGEFNSMFGRKQSDEQKRKSSEKGRERFANNPEKYHALCTSKLIEYNIKYDFAQAKQPRAKRVELICDGCGCSKTVTETYAKSHKYCSSKCACANASIYAIEATHQHKLEKDIIIREIVLDIATNNKSEILEIKLNKIQTSEIMNFIIGQVKNKTEVFDMRTISEAICGEKSRKALILFLKEYVS